MLGTPQGIHYTTTDANKVALYSEPADLDAYFRTLEGVIDKELRY